jgi:hypothetical protein
VAKPENTTFHNAAAFALPRFLYRLTLFCVANPTSALP